MGFVRQASAAAILVTMTLWLQAAGMAVLIEGAKSRIDRGLQGIRRRRTAVLMVRYTTMMIGLHLMEILLWTAFYRWYCLPTWESCFYFSAASYSTVGYGDVVLPRLWRSLGPLESVVGVLMSGFSVSALFAIVIRLISSEEDSPPNDRPSAKQILTS